MRSCGASCPLLRIGTRLRRAMCIIQLRTAPPAAALFILSHGRQGSPRAFRAASSAVERALRPRCGAAPRGLAIPCPATVAAAACGLGVVRAHVSRLLVSFVVRRLGFLGASRVGLAGRLAGFGSGSHQAR